MNHPSLITDRESLILNRNSAESRIHASPLAISHGATTRACLRARAIASLRWNRRLGIHLQPPTSASCVCSR